MVRHHCFQDVWPFLIAVLGELGGTYAIWRWLRTGSPPLLGLVGAAALLNAPYRFDWIGATIVLVGAIVILWARRISA